MTVKFFDKYDLDTHDVYLPLGHTIDLALKRNKLNFKRCKNIFPVDDRLTSYKNGSNFFKLNELLPFLERNKIKRLHQQTTFKRSSTFVLSVAEDLHFSSLWGANGDLHRNGSIVKTSAFHTDYSKRISVGYQTLMRFPTIFLFSDTNRFKNFQEFSKSNIRIKLVLEKAMVSIIGD